MLKKLLIEYVLENVDIEDIRYTYSRMCIHRHPLCCENYSLECKLEDLVKDFIEVHELNEDWFETEVGLIEDLFDELLKEL